ncbi:hypothetical protein [Sphingomonas sp. HDW15A]|uniref:hypothetical protein n=1 Tax=Sphingomonas sp. HDW15A TaxID=2714942 RepID=UPI001F0E2A0C|nr:hypothetical protein [Sphingomonas sp. HDW15A]
MALKLLVTDVTVHFPSVVLRVIRGAIAQLVLTVCAFAPVAPARAALMAALISAIVVPVTS